MVYMFFLIHIRTIRFIVDKKSIFCYTFDKLYMEVAMSLEKLIYDKISSLSAGQRRVAEYILNNKDIFSYATLAKLSKDISVSETTIIRCAYSLGFDSFSALQQKIRNEILSIPQRSLEDSTFNQSFYQNIFARETNALRDWIARIDESLLDRVTDTLLNADRILVTGARSSYHAANWFGNRLNLMLGNAYVVQEFYDPRFDLLNNITNKTVILSIAFARYTKWTYRYAESAKKTGATLVTITDTLSSPFFDISDYTILAAPIKDSMGFSSPICMYCLFDAITAKIHSQRKGVIVERLKKYEDAYQDFDMYYE